VVSRYGLSRTHPQIWSNFHWFVDYMRRTRPVEAGIYDMNRYKKVADLMADESGAFKHGITYVGSPQQRQQAGLNAQALPAVIR
jgi:hypothetical protein